MRRHAPTPLLFCAPSCPRQWTAAHGSATATRHISPHVHLCRLPLGQDERLAKAAAGAQAAGTDKANTGGVGRGWQLTASAATTSLRGTSTTRPLGPRRSAGGLTISWRAGAASRAGPRQPARRTRATQATRGLSARARGGRPGGGRPWRAVQLETPEGPWNHRNQCFVEGPPSQSGCSSGREPVATSSRNRRRDRGGD